MIFMQDHYRRNKKTLSGEIKQRACLQEGENLIMVMKTKVGKDLNQSLGRALSAIKKLRTMNKGFRKLKAKENKESKFSIMNVAKNASENQEDVVRQ
ncbi:hypothetical protein AXF42_Ash020003 [Apostasia shenzhenica]|uniref:Uncharacterized protein n=1 Tax=Apostasia shenzhenica TaxID=1088818 RepID=A0A2H9ZSI2_9ASPA|nr:hypothetical protein AXF42_Ash020003 [Apostasia shenzhenica]